MNADGEVYDPGAPLNPAPVVDTRLWIGRLRRKLQHPGRAWKGGGGTTGVLKELRDHGEDVEEMCAVERQLLQDPHEKMDTDTRAAYLRWLVDRHRWILSGIDAKLIEIERRDSRLSA